MTAVVCLTLGLLVGGPPAAKGQVMLLDNGRVVHGDIERIDGQYRLLRDESEVRLPLNRVLFVGPDVASIYRHLLTQIRPDNPAARVKLARWCLTQGLKAEAHAEACAALELKPNDPSALLLRDAVARLVATEQTAANALRELTPVSATQEQPPEVESNSASYPLFATKVHVVLMNRCASCHATNAGGGFVLMRGSDARSVRWNLAASLAQINRTEPDQSALLRKAASLHGTLSRPALESRDMAYQYLELWAFAATSPEGTPITAVTIRRGQPAAADGEPGTLPVSVQTATPLPEKVEPGAGFAEMRPVSAPTAPMGSDPLDPFDPAIFHRQTGAVPPKPATEE